MFMICNAGYDMQVATIPRDSTGGQRLGLFAPGLDKWFPE